VVRSALRSFRTFGDARYGFDLYVAAVIGVAVFLAYSDRRRDSAGKNRKDKLAGKGGGYTLILRNWRRTRVPNFLAARHTKPIPRRTRLLGSGVAVAPTVARKVKSVNEVTVKLPREVLRLDQSPVDRSDA
jgi:hypothetical protein